MKVGVIGAGTMGQGCLLYTSVIEQMSDTIVEKSGENITQQLYEQMKRNYNCLLYTSRCV